jgi:DNA-binding CsgD family transcriptional regulator
MLVGRRAELAALQGVLDQAAEASASPVLLVGDPGVGKSRLLRAITATARLSGFRVLAAACPDGSAEIRYGVAADLVAAATDLLPRLSSADQAVLDSLSEGGAPGPARVATALLRLLSAADAEAPVAVVIDDLHAADPDSVATLTLAAARLPGRRVAVIVASLRHPAADPRIRSWERIDVGPLEPDAAVALLLHSLPAGMRDCLRPTRARLLADALGRNPTALRECSRLLSEAEICGSSPLPDPVPVGERLASAWGRAFDSLTGTQQDAVLVSFVAAQHGRAVLDSLLSDLGASAADVAAGTAVGLTATNLHGGADPLSRTGQPLVQSAVLAWACPDRVRRLHRRAAAAADQLGLPPAVVISHLRAAATGEDCHLVTELEAQAERALARGQVRAAALAIEAAALVSPAGARRTRLAVRAARLRLSISQSVDDPGALLGILDAADLSAEDQVWVELLRTQHLSPRDLRAALAALRRAAEHARLVGSAALPQILVGASFLTWAVGDGESALELAELLLEHESSTSSVQTSVPPWAGSALRGIALFQVGDVGSAEEDLSAARALSAAWSHEPDADLALLVNVVLLDEALGTRRSVGDARLDLAVHRLEGDTGEMIGIIRNVQAARALRRGDVTTARILVDEGLDLARAALHSQDILLRLCTSARIDSMVGDRERLAAEVDELRSLAERLGQVLGPAYADRAEGLLALADGRHADAVSVLARLDGDLLLGMGPSDPVPMGRGDLVEALVGAGDVDGAREMVRRLVTLLAESSDPAARGLIARATGLVTPGHEGLRALGRAADHWADAGEAFETARTRLLLGEQLLLSGENAIARIELRSAATTFDLIGAQPWRRRATAALRRAEEERAEGGELAIPAATRSRLTAAEIRVAQAVATGATNKEVAADLHLSPRTVEHHLASVYRKLGVRTRTALVARLSSVPEEFTRQDAGG